MVYFAVFARDVSHGGSLLCPEVCTRHVVSLGWVGLWGIDCRGAKNIGVKGGTRTNAGALGA